MQFRRYGRLAAFGVAFGTAGVQAVDTSITPASGWAHRKLSPAPPAATTPCPTCGPQAQPGTPTGPTTPGTLPNTPGTPGTPGTTPPETPPVFGQGPGSNTNDSLAQNNSQSLAQATQGGGGAEATALPQVFGDLIGGSLFAGPLPVRFASNGQLVGPVPVVVLPNGQRVTLGPRPPIVDENLLLPVRPTPAQIANGTTVGLVPPQGTVFADSLRDAVARVPTYFRGAFKITENDTPRPTTRAYMTYNFYDNVVKTSGGPGVPRIMLHQQVLGYEQAFADRQFSVGVRLPYNQLVSPNFINDTGLGDLTLIGKAVLLEDRSTGNLLSGGFVVTVPTAVTPYSNTLTGTTYRSTLLQPYLGYIYQSGNAFVQGFSSIVAPTDNSDVTFIANDISVGYRAYNNPGNWLSGLFPVLELHVNNPVNHRSLTNNQAGFTDTVTMLGGLHAFFNDKAGLGAACGAPLTGPRPFSLQATIQFNYRF